MDNKVMVSVICNTFNHGNYIKQALDGFIMQITDFSFEVLIHDDASTDNTADIIKEYESKYPEIIKPIYQKENQYSKSYSFIEKAQYSRVRGKYIAFCEGDDYWTDQYKLQKQFDLMEIHPEVDMCAHGAYKVNNGQIIGEVAPKRNMCIIPIEEVILGGGGFLATNSLFYRAEMRNNKPNFIKDLYLDYFVQIWGALKGGIIYIPENMACYRVAASGSWSERMRVNTAARIEHINRVNQSLRILDDETNNRYSKEINDHITENRFTLLEIEHRYSEIKSEEFRDIYRKLPLNRKIIIKLKQVLHDIGLYK